VRATTEAESRQGQDPGRLAEEGSQGYEEDRPARPRQGLRHVGDRVYEIKKCFFLGDWVAGLDGRQIAQRYAACLKALQTSSPFFDQALRKIALAGTLLPDGAEDKALPGGNLSADSGAKTRPGFGVQLNPGNKIINWDWHQQR
jgi:hypothetical protein